MNLENLIQLHNQALNRKVEENIYLQQRLKARWQERQRSRHSSWRLPLKKSLLVYSILLILFTILNFILVNSLENHKILSKPVQQVEINLNAFSPHYPGSISKAFQQVMK